MNLKETFRYQNFLSGLESNALMALHSSSNYFIQTNNHLKSIANPDAADEIEVVPMPDGVYPPDKVMDFLLKVIGEKGKVAEKVNAIKLSMSEDLDAMVIENKARRAVLSGLRRVLMKKPGSTIETGTDYRFNAEGNQVPYKYKIEVTKEDNFDREYVKKTMKALSDLADEKSAKIDAYMVNTNVDFEPLFDVNSSFEDIMDEMLSE